MVIQIGTLFSKRNIRIIASVVLVLLLANGGYPIRPVPPPRLSPLYADAVRTLARADISFDAATQPYPGALTLGDASRWLITLYRHYAPYPIPLRPEAAAIADPGYTGILEMLSLGAIESYTEFVYTPATYPTGAVFARMLVAMDNRIEADAFDSWYTPVTVREARELLAPIYRIATGGMIDPSPSFPVYDELYRGLIPEAGSVTSGQFYAMAYRLYETVTGPEASPEGLPGPAVPSDTALTRADLAGACEGLLDALALYMPATVQGQEAVVEIGRLAAHFIGRQPAVKQCRSVQNDRSYPWYIDQGDTGPDAEYNCAPVCAAMAAHWHDEALTLDPAILGGRHGAAYPCWTTDDIKEALSHYGVPYSIEPIGDESVLVEALDAGCLLLLVVDLGAGSHTVLAKGYRRLGDDVWLTCYDPGSFGRTDALGYPVGQDAEYHIRYLLTASQWDYFLCVSPGH